MKGVPPALRGFVEIALRILAVRYVRAYRRRQPLDAAQLTYHEALARMMGVTPRLPPLPS